MRIMKLFLYALIVLTGAIQLYLAFNTPSQIQIRSPQIDPHQLGYVSLFQNPIIQVLFCLSIIIMLSGILYIRKVFGETKFGYTNLNTIFFIMILGFFGIATQILWVNWNYIDISFKGLMNMLLYEGYNPSAETHSN